MSRKYEDLERAAVLDDEGGEPRQPSDRKRVKRLPHLPGPFVRIPIAWLNPSSVRPAPFTATQRLYLLLLYRSHWGQRGVKLTSAVAAEIGMPPRSRQWSLSRLERDGLVRVERSGRSAPIVWPIVVF
jgi:hypothetical protein